MPRLSRILVGRFFRRWQRFWTARAGPRGMGRLAARLASWRTHPYQSRAFLADLHPRGYVAHTAAIAHPNFTLGNHVYVGDHVYAFAGDANRGSVELRDRVHLYGDTVLQTGFGGRIIIGEETHVQPRCHFSAYLADIVIGCRVEIAPTCSFYSYDHGTAPGKPVRTQPFQTKGPIQVGDDAWLGHGVTVLSGVTIGRGAVIAAGSVVNRSIPDHAIAAGVPARVLRYR